MRQCYVYAPQNAPQRRPNKRKLTPETNRKTLENPKHKRLMEGDHRKYAHNKWRVKQEKEREQKQKQKQSEHRNGGVCVSVYTPTAQQTP